MWGAWYGSGTPHSQDTPPDFYPQGCGASPFHICTPSSSLDGYGFFNSIVVRLPCNLISDDPDWWLLYILVVILMWLCKEVSHVCLRHHLARSLSTGEILNTPPTSRADSLNSWFNHSGVKHRFLFTALVITLMWCQGREIPTLSCFSLQPLPMSRYSKEETVKCNGCFFLYVLLVPLSALSQKNICHSIFFKLDSQWPKGSGC